MLKRLAMITRKAVTRIPNPPAHFLHEKRAPQPSESRGHPISQPNYVNSSRRHVWSQWRQCRPSSPYSAASTASSGSQRQQPASSMAANPEVIFSDHPSRITSSKQHEDTWSWVEIGVPFPDGPVKARGANNEYVALWYKHGKPVCGRAWNNGGVVECSFAYEKFELTGKKDLGGQIQILAYDNSREEIDVWKDWGYVYRWIQWKQRRDGGKWIGLVRCGNSVPIQVQHGDEWYCGNIDISSETVTWSHGGKAYTETDPRKINEMWTIVRDATHPYWTPPKPEEPAPPPEVPPPPPEPPKVYDDRWMDLRENDDFSRIRYGIKAMNRPLKMPDGTVADCYVALWYKRGKPVMGRVWDNGGKIAASFGMDGKEHSKDVGSLQLLSYNPETAGFDIDWKPFSEAWAGARTGGEWKPVHVKEVAPCIVPIGGGEVLGKVLIAQERAAASWNGKEHEFRGPAVQNMLVLSRRDKK